MYIYLHYYYIGGSLYVGLRLIFQDGGRFYDFQTLILRCTAL